MRPFRLLLTCVVALGLAPGTMVRSTPAKDYTSSVEIVQLETAPGQGAGPFVVDNAWELRSENDLVGGYSALMLRSEGDLIAASDAGRLLFLRFKDGDIVKAVPTKFVDTLDQQKHSVDIEALASDPETGRFWAAYENTNAIQRFSPEFRPEAQAFPDAMRDWSMNAGPEAMARLPDGSFLVIAEGARRFGGRGGHDALLFSNDPTQSVSSALRFVFEGLDGYRPVDLAVLPDGRVLVLMRSWSLGLPPVFHGAIMIANPADIKPDGIWKARLLAKLGPPVPIDNYEGLAVEHGSDGETYLWLVSDDNFMMHQRSLLLRLRWERQKARE